ncbi:hypothetical protein [Desulfobacter hydrogenophilus]|uniref:hypothetical protein n=1 Tax=Desulfobacter hydrogenophilus TaxID=2291 RepID=UPI001F5FD376|nr:hypothetical protein [Desulfobacter hydrogenophilus]
MKLPPALALAVRYGPFFDAMLKAVKRNWPAKASSPGSQKASGIRTSPAASGRSGIFSGVASIICAASLSFLNSFLNAVAMPALSLVR